MGSINQSQKPADTAYQKILQKINKILEPERIATETNEDWVRAKSYYEVGRILNKESSRRNIEDFLALQNNLSKKLKFNLRKIQRIHQFYKTWPDSIPFQTSEEAIAWTKIVELLSVPEKSAQLYYLKEVQKSNWSRGQLRQAIHENLYENRNILTRFKKQVLQTGRSIVDTFWAEPLRVIDGDTLFVRFDLRFFMTCSDEIRLRGINCPELNDPSGLGKEAKAFVEKELHGITRFVVVTYKSDKFGRYVGDIYYSKIYNTVEDIIEKGHFLNQRLLDARLAKRVEYL